VLNRLIVWIAENDLQSEAYSICGTIPLFIAGAYGLWYGHKIKMRAWKSFCVVELGSYAWGQFMNIVMWANSGFREFGDRNVAVVFVYIPVIAWLLSKIFRERYEAVSDQLAFTAMLMYGFGRWGCVFFGCCYGYPCSWGIYNPWKDAYLFPVAILESVIALTLVGVLLYLSKKQNYKPTGRLLPILLTVYGILRFFIEFLHDNEKVLFGCSKLAFHALFMAIVGAILWMRKRKQQRRIVS